MIRTQAVGRLRVDQIISSAVKRLVLSLHLLSNGLNRLSGGPDFSGSRGQLPEYHVRAGLQIAARKLPEKRGQTIEPSCAMAGGTPPGAKFVPRLPPSYQTDGANLNHKGYTQAGNPKYLPRFQLRQSVQQKNRMTSRFWAIWPSPLGRNLHKPARMPELHRLVPAYICTPGITFSSVVRYCLPPPGPLRHRGCGRRGRGSGILGAIAKARLQSALSPAASWLAIVNRSPLPFPS